jgi:heptaprenyl diphosphate synthase
VKGRFGAKRVALLGALTAGALIMFLIESLFPSLILPGAKLGLGNIFTMLAVILLGGTEATVLVVAKTVLGCLIVGNPGALIYSLSAGLASVAVGTFLFRFAFPKVSVVAIGVASAAVHNTVQNLVFCLVTNTPEMLALLPYLLLLGAGSGLAVGFAVYLLITKIPVAVYEKVTDEGNKRTKNGGKK